MYDQQVSSSRYVIRSSILVLLTFATAFFPRVVAAIGVPSLVNFVHFGVLAILVGLTLPRTPVKIWNYLSKQIWFGLFILLVLIVASALFNLAGVSNVILDFILLSEPFVLLLAVVSIPMSKASVKQFRFWIMLFAFIHLFFAYFQYFILRLQPDDVKGVFLRQGAGHHVGGAIALTAAVYFFFTFKSLSIWLRTFVAIVFAADIVFSDSKQVVVVFVISLIIWVCINLKQFSEALRYLAIVIITICFVFLVAKLVFPGPLAYWGNTERLITGMSVKFSVFSIINFYYHSPLNWLIGLGPGHTIGRLAWLIPDYIRYLQPLGITSSPVTAAIFAENNTNALSNIVTGSSMFSLTFSWAGIWGDLGLLGVGAYLYLWFLVWRQCPDNLSKFLLITVLVFGGIFSWLEEPGYMLFIAILIGFQWQEHHITTTNSPKLSRTQFLKTT